MAKRMNERELLTRAYARTHQAADVVSRMELQRRGPEPGETVELVKLLREATAAATALNGLVQGNPPPKDGD